MWEGSVVAGGRRMQVQTGGNGVSERVPGRAIGRTTAPVSLTATVSPGSSATAARVGPDIMIIAASRPVTIAAPAEVAIIATRSRAIR
jgi:hypothetical protein